MSRFSIRPQSMTFGLPGFGRNKAHADKRSGTRQTGDKLPTLEPLAAQALLRSDSRHSGQKAKLLIDRANARQANEPARPRRGVAKVLSRLPGKAAVVLGLKHRNPQSHAKLLHYADPGAGAAAVRVPATAVPASAPPTRTPAALRDVIPALVHTLEREQALLQAQIDANHASGAKAALVRDIERIEADVGGLVVRRAVNLDDRVMALERQYSGLTAALDAELAAVTTLELALGSALESAPDGAVDAAHPGEPVASQSAHGRHASVVARLEQELDDLRQHARQAAVALHTGRARPECALLEDAVNQANGKIAAKRPQLADARAALQQWQWHQGRADELERRRGDVAAQIEQTLHSSQINTAQVRETEQNIAGLAALRRPLQEVVDNKTGVLEATRAQAQAARAGLAQESQALLSGLVEQMPGFDAGAGTEAAQHALLAWSGGLAKSCGVFGTDALPPASVLGIAMQALGMAAGGDPALAGAALRELASLSLHDLIPAPGAPGNAPASDPALSAATRATLALLAAEPRGMQVISHLLARPEAVTVKEAALVKQQLYAARIYLQADDAHHRAAPDDDTGRRYLEHARNAVRRAVRAPTVSLGLAGATAGERAAYHALRNGYPDQAAGSTYQKANQHLRMLADWQHDAEASRPPWQSGAHSPFHALREALTLASATGLPTPARRAHDELAKAADCLFELILARRHQLPPGQAPAESELALRAVAEHVQEAGRYSDLLTVRLETAALGAIGQRLGELRRHFAPAPHHGGAAAAPVPVPVPVPAPAHPALDATWQALQSTQHTVAEAMSLLQKHLLQSPGPRTPGPQAQAPASTAQDDAAHFAARENRQRSDFHAAVGKANRLLYDGDPARVTSGAAFQALFEDMLGHLEWRDKLRFAEQKVKGVNLGPLSAAFAVLGLPVGARLILSLQTNSERVIEFYMGRTGPYMQIGKQKASQSQAGAGLNGGCIWSLGKKLRMGLGWSADLRVRTESGIEQGVQLRIPRRARGHDVEIGAQFLDMFEHLVHLAKQEHEGAGAPADWMRELLAHHPDLNIGLIDHAPRKTVSTESNISGGALLRAARVRIGATVGLKSRQDTSNTSATVAGNMKTIYNDSTAQTKTDLVARLGASAQAAAFKDKGSTGLTTSFLDLSYAREIRSKGRTHFCTLFTFDDEIDPVRSDRAIDFQSFKEFEQEVRNDWDAWVHYGIPKLAAKIDPDMQYAVAEKQLENFLDHTRTFTRTNKLATMYIDYVLKAETAPMLDALRAQASLWRKAGREELAQQADSDFNRLMVEPSLWEPAILVLREKTKLQHERGIDLFLKVQRNRLAESQRTVGQWVQYEPVERAEPGQQIAYQRTWPGGDGDGAVASGAA